MAESSFRAGGLASGLDTNLIIDKLVELESRPLDLVRKRQTGLKTQISEIGKIRSKLSELSSAAKTLASSGSVATKVTTSHTGFDATTGAGAIAGRHTVTVSTLASAASALSTGFASSSTVVNTGQFDFTVQGVAYGFTVAAGTTLSDMATKIRETGAPISATVISDGTLSYLSLTNNQTGTPTSGAALSITDTSGILGATVTAANNAAFNVNGLPITRSSNTVSDVIPGVTLSLKAQPGTAETLVIGNDTEGTKTNVGKFVDAYNGVLKMLQAQLVSPPGSDRSATLAGDTSIRGLQSNLQALLTTKVSEVSTVTIRTLADIGLKTASDGALSIDTTVLNKALGKDAQAVNDLFSKTTVGLGAVTKSLVERFNNISNGLFASRTKGLQDSVKKLDGQIANMELRLQGRRTELINQFTAMEKVVSTMKSTGNFLTQVSANGFGFGG